MCTVSFVPVKDKIFITSNRDEKLSRKKGIEPAANEYNGYKILFPKDADAGGTWIAAKENGDAAVLLNGAFINHLPEPPYRKSRGLILLDILASEIPSIQFTKIDLENIEPFTSILLEKNLLYEFRWDGAERFHRQLSPLPPQLWSSATLYDGLAVKKREQWFADFLDKNPSPSLEEIMNFHRFTGDGDLKNDLLMRRDGAYSTVSITSIVLERENIKMHYLDLMLNKEYSSALGLSPVPVK
jgi:hypothetical protein